MRVRLTVLASSDLEAIADYIAQDNPDPAAAVVLRVLDALDLLGTFPDVGRLGRVDGTREAVLARTPFVAAYRVRDDTVEVLRVSREKAHGRCPGPGSGSGQQESAWASPTFQRSADVGGQIRRRRA